MSTQRPPLRTPFIAALMAALLLSGPAMAAKGGKPKPPPEPPPPPPPAVEYGMMILAPPSGAASWTPLAVNNHGDVVGVADGLPDGRQRAVLCPRDSSQAFLMDDLVQLPADVVRLSAALDVSDAGWISGNATVVDADGQYRLHAFRCTADGISIAGFEELGAPTGFTWTYGQAIGNHGDVAVDAENDGSSVMGGFICTAAGDWIDIPGTLVARDINDHNEVASWIYVDGQPHACRYTMDGDVVEDLGALGRGLWSRGYAINASGQVAGSAATKKFGQRAVRYTDGDGMEDLGVLPIEGRSVSSYSTARAINASGDVVGTSGNGQSGIQREFLYTDATGMLDLAELVVAPLSGFDANSLHAEAINDSGVVCGKAMVDGLTTGVLLAPIE